MKKSIDHFLNRGPGRFKKHTIPIYWHTTGSGVTVTYTLRVRETPGSIPGFPTNFLFRSKFLQRFFFKFLYFFL